MTHGIDHETRLRGAQLHTDQVEAELKWHRLEMSIICLEYDISNAASPRDAASKKIELQEALLEQAKVELAVLDFDERLVKFHEEIGIRAKEELVQRLRGMGFSVVVDPFPPFGGGMFGFGPDFDLSREMSHSFKENTESPGKKNESRPYPRD